MGPGVANIVDPLVAATAADPRVAVGGMHPDIVPVYSLTVNIYVFTYLKVPLPQQEKH